MSRPFPHVALSVVDGAALHPDPPDGHVRGVDDQAGAVGEEDVLDDGAGLGDLEVAALDLARASSRPARRRSTASGALRCARAAGSRPPGPATCSPQPPPARPAERGRWRRAAPPGRRTSGPRGRCRSSRRGAGRWRARAAGRRPSTPGTRGRRTGRATCAARRGPGSGPVTSGEGEQGEARRRRPRRPSTRPRSRRARPPARARARRPRTAARRGTTRPRGRLTSRWRTARRSSRGTYVARGGHPARLVADLLAAEGAPACRRPGSAGGRRSTWRQRTPSSEQVEREEQVLRRRRAEAVRERDVAADRHAGAAQPDRDAEAVAAARDGDALQRERGERGLLGAGVRPRPLSLRAWTAWAPEAIARSQAAKKPGSITESASSISTASHSSARACSSPACRAAARPGRLVRAALEHGRAERARDLGRASVQRSATTSTRSLRPPVGHDRLRGSWRSPAPRCAPGTSTRKRSSRLVGGPRLAVEPGRERQQTEMGCADQAGEAEQDRRRDDEGLDVHGLPFPRVGADLSTAGPLTELRATAFGGYRIAGPDVEPVGARGPCPVSRRRA